ncbi:MAG: S-methyl-5-thioribose-1-phosphate isomerase [Phycisphaerales bacterium]|nr:S-methyl-5-thioribose-1-phosphate isomerase [Phycisphaerales bacterium]
MLVHGKPMRAIWSEGPKVCIIDQTRLPFAVEIASLHACTEAAQAIANMQVRGAPLIGATAAWGMALAMASDPSDLNAPAELLKNSRPTAVNLAWAVDRMVEALDRLSLDDRPQAARAMAQAICDEDVACNTAIGRHGLDGLRNGLIPTHRPLHIMTICNAGWLATVDRGTATATIYAARDAGVEVRVTCLETRPRRQGALLTAWELEQEGIEHRIIVDSAAASVLRDDDIDLVIAGTDRTAANGDVCNKIGTYALALGAQAAGVPFWVAAPTSSIDPNVSSGNDIPIEHRSAMEVTHAVDGQGHSTTLTNPGSDVYSPAFDVTPAALVNTLLTEHGPCETKRTAIARVLNR